MVMLFDIYNLPENIFRIIFATEQQVIVANLLLQEFKAHNNALDKAEMSLFANTLHAGIMVDKESGEGSDKKKERAKVSYNKRQFYDRILTPLRMMGMIDYNLSKKKYIISFRFMDELGKIGMLWKKEAHNSMIPIP